MGKDDPAFRKAIEVGGVDLASVTAEVGIPHVIGQDQDDIRATFQGRGGCRFGTREACRRGDPSGDQTPKGP